MSDTTVRLRADQVAPLDRYAQADGRSRSNAVQRAVDMLLRNGLAVRSQAPVDEPRSE
jgi:hypothetical protein